MTNHLKTQQKSIKHVKRPKQKMTSQPILQSGIHGG